MILNMYKGFTTWPNGWHWWKALILKSSAPPLCCMMLRGPPPEQKPWAVHHHTSAEFAGQVLQAEHWPDDRIAAVQHCIRAHRFRDVTEPPATIEARVLFDADKLDVLGAIGVARVIAYASLAGKPFYAEPSQHFLQTGEKEAGEPHSAYHEYLFKLSKSRTACSRRKPAALPLTGMSICGIFQRLQDELLGSR